MEDMLDTETLSEKMKRFESELDVKLQVKTPVIIRIDGKAFHTFTNGLEKPFDKDLSEAMQYTALKIAEEIQNVKFIYSQSDEINILLTDWDNLNTDSWFNYRIQKLVSVSASMTTSLFNKKLNEITSNYWSRMMARDIPYDDEKYYTNKYELWKSKKFKALFDSRAFNMPKEEVSNYFLQRYMDAKRNSVLALAHNIFTQSELENVNVQDMIAKIKEKSEVDYMKLPSIQKVGFAVYKDENNKWKLDLEVPDIYENRDYVEKWLK